MRICLRKRGPVYGPVFKVFEFKLKDLYSPPYRDGERVNTNLSVQFNTNNRTICVVTFTDCG